MLTMTRKYISSKFATGMMQLPGKMPGERIDLFLIKGMKEAGIDPEVIYAFEKTLLWITDNNLKNFLGHSNFTKAELDAWDAAIEEYSKGVA